MSQAYFSDILNIQDDDKRVKLVHITYMQRYVTSFDWNQAAAVRAIFQHMCASGTYYCIELFCGCSYDYDKNGKQTSCSMCENHYAETEE